MKLSKEILVNEYNCKVSTKKIDEEFIEIIYIDINKMNKILVKCQEEAGVDESFIERIALSKRNIAAKNFFDCDQEKLILEKGEFRVAFSRIPNKIIEAYSVVFDNTYKKN